MPPPRRARRFHRSAKILGMATITEELPAGGYNPSMYELLKTIDDPSRLRTLERKQLQQLADELRAYVLESVSATGGHLSSNLGTVELTIALHYVFRTPEDKLIWDVGHQTYGHKILTGRRKGMAKLRQKGGIAGFPRREESPYDTFGTAHSSRNSASTTPGPSMATTSTSSSTPLPTSRASRVRNSCTSSRARDRATSRPRKIPSPTTVRASSIPAWASCAPSPRPMRARGPLIRRSSATGFATWRGSTSGSSALRPRCARARGWSSS